MWVFIQSLKSEVKRSFPCLVIINLLKKRKLKAKSQIPSFFKLISFNLKKVPNNQNSPL